MIPFFQQELGTYGNEFVEKNLSMKGRVFPFFFIFFFSIVSDLLFIVTIVEELEVVLKLAVLGAGKVSGLTRLIFSLEEFWCYREEMNNVWFYQLAHETIPSTALSHLLRTSTSSSRQVLPISLSLREERTDMISKDLLSVEINWVSINCT